MRKEIRVNGMINIVRMSRYIPIAPIDSVNVSESGMFFSMMVRFDLPNI